MSKELWRLKKEHERLSRIVRQEYDLIGEASTIGREALRRVERQISELEGKDDLMSMEMRRVPWRGIKLQAVCIEPVDEESIWSKLKEEEFLF